MRVSTEYFREQASRLRDIARRAAHPIRDELIKVAIEYDRLADEAERKER